MEEQIQQLKRKKSKDDNIATKTPEFDKQRFMVSILRPLILCIGRWKFEPTNDGDELVVRGYFVRKQLTWEVLSNAYRGKIEIEWSNIVGIRASLTINEPGILEVELSQPPKFYKELENVEQRAHEKWVEGLDFTRGEASNCRRHLVMFPAGMLDKHFERLINFEKRFWELSQKPYPTSNKPYFKMPCNVIVPTQQIQSSNNQTHQLISYGAPNLISPGPETTNHNSQQNSSSAGGEIRYSPINFNNAPYSSFSSAWPTDSRGVWLPPRLQVDKKLDESSFR